MSTQFFAKKPLALASTLFISGLASTVSLAEADVKKKDLEEMVVVASRIELPLRQQAVSVSVLDQQAIENRGYLAVTDVLRDQLSIHVSNSGGLGKQTALRIRGEESFRTKVLIDGINISDPTNTQVAPQLQHIMTAGVGRIEILRGAQGMAYGADAGGVISILSSRGKEGLNGSVAAEAGRYGSKNISASVAAGNEVGDLSLNIADANVDGFNARTTDTSGELDGYENTTIHFNAGLNLTENWRVQATLRDVDAYNEYDNGSTDFEQENQRFSALYKGDKHHHELSYSNNDVSRVFSSGYTAIGSIEEYRWLANSQLNDQQRVVYGLDLEQQEHQSNNSSRDQLGAHIEWQAQPVDALYLTAGVRHDDNDDFGRHNSYRISAAYLMDFNQGALKIKSALGNGFRAPSLAEIALNRRANAAELKEEASRSAELGLQWFGNNGLELEAVLFHQKVEDEIRFFYDPSSPTFGYYEQEPGDSRSRGVELSYQQAFGALQLRANATYNDTQDSSGDIRLRRPRVLASAGFDYQWHDAGITLSANLRHSGDQRDRSGDIKAYSLADIRLNWAINQHIAVYTRLENALDKEYQEVPSYNTARAAAYAGVKLSF